MKKINKLLVIILATFSFILGSKTVLAAGNPQMYGELTITTRDIAEYDYGALITFKTNMELTNADLYSSFRIYNSQDGSVMNYYLATDGFKILTDASIIEEFQNGISIKEAYENTAKIDANAIIPAGTTLYCYKEQTYLVAPTFDKVEVYLNYATTAKKYFYEDITYNYLNNALELVSNTLHDDTIAHNFMESLAEKYPNVTPLKGDSSWMEFGYITKKDEKGEATDFVTLGSIDFTNKTTEQLVSEMDALIATLKENGSVISRGNLAEIKYAETPVVVFSEIDNPKAAQWIFDGSQLSDEDIEKFSTISLKVTQKESAHKDVINSLVAGTAGSLILDFKHSGELPKGTRVRIFVGDDFKDNDSLALYYFNPTTNNIENVLKDIVVTGGYVEFALEHCSEYVLVSTGTTVKSQDNNVQTSSMNVILYSIISVTSVAGLIYILKNKSKEIA